MRVLLDTNVLLRLSDATHQMYVATETGLSELRLLGQQPVLFPQII